MTTFLDSSALVKLYADEADAELVRDLDDDLLASELARVEVPAAFWRKQRMGELTAEQARVLAARFRADRRGRSDRTLSFVRVTPAVLTAAAALVARHPVRAYDAVQLASAAAAAAAIGDCRFACFDLALSTAAAAEGLAPAWG